MSLPSVLRDRLRLPVIASPMFIVSNPDLVIAQCTAGIVGSFPSLNARPQSELRVWLTRITEALAAHDAAHPEAPSAPYAVNLIVHKSNDRLEEDLRVVEEFRVPVVITSLGAQPEVNERIHAYGGVVLHDVIHDGFARKAIAKGADGLIAVAAGAGGHAGSQSPFALIQEIRAWFDGPLALSGSITHGRSVLAALAAGADLAYIGSMFIATEEANAAAEYKQMIVDSSAADIVYTDRFTGVHGNYLRPSIVAAGLDPEQLHATEAATLDLGDGDVVGAKAWRDIWGAGHGVGGVTEIRPAATVVDQLAAEYAAARERLLAV
ncbi:MAG TPA: nitronate monooxygenase family protein [Nocardia sp.]|uniref:NAD(P)H-dependent flavin oxidoreductase n=1 Tax=Nocardia sp. TaxID=1821 RepID=UPI002B4AE635|nr:nitronate monooxygenase family protein [Nocardia sp.]HLS75645.1 nitronate monooxygenase family protein [Nocardia sp.]